MACRIVLWDSDRSLREALFSRLFRKGFLPISLEDPGKLSKAVRWLCPELVLFEAGWEKGRLVQFADSARPTDSEGELTLIMPLAEPGRPAGDPLTRGLVLDKLRKPFGTQQLIDGIAAALDMRGRLRSRATQAREWLEIKPLTNAAEIEAALALRLQVYRETGFVSGGSSAIEHDCYDPDAVLFGAFHNQGTGRSLAGTIRVLRRSGELSEGREELIRAVRSHEPGYSPAASADPPELPSLVTFGLSPEKFQDLHPGFGGPQTDSGKAVKEEIFELSRLAISPAYRRSHFGIERKLFQMIVVDSCALGRPRNWFVISVHPTRRAKFERFGFRAIECLGVRPYASLKQPAILMTLDLQHYLATPNPFSASLETELLLYRASGYLSHVLEAGAAKREACQQRSR